MVCLACGGRGWDDILHEGAVTAEPCDWCDGTGLWADVPPDVEDYDDDEPPYRDDYEEYRLEREGLL